MANSYFKINIELVSYIKTIGYIKNYYFINSSQLFIEIDYLIMKRVINELTVVFFNYLKFTNPPITIRKDIILIQVIWKYQALTYWHMF